jgi:hypothetical protein
MKTTFSFLVFITIVLVAAGLAFGHIPVLSEIKPDHIMSYAGTVVTVLSFTTGVYFVWLAVNSYGVIRDIEGKAAAIDGGVDRLSQRQQDAERRLADVENRSKDAHNRIIDGVSQAAQYRKLARQFMDELMLNVNDLQEKIPADDKKEERAVRMSRLRYRLAFEAEQNESQKLAFARPLIQIGTPDDLAHVREFLASVTNDDKASLLAIVDAKLREHGKLTK